MAKKFEHGVRFAWQKLFQKKYEKRQVEENTFINCLIKYLVQKETG